FKIVPMDLRLPLVNWKKFAVFLLIALCFTRKSEAQYKYTFTDPWQEFCTDINGYCDSTGSSWRFLNVCPGTDAIVHIDYLSPNASLEGIDNDFYYREAFLPQI